MEFKKTKDLDFAKGAAMAAGATVGFVAPAAIANAFANANEGDVLTDDQKQKKLIVNGASAALGLAGLLFIKGSDLTADTLRATSAGLAGGGTKGVVQHFTADKVSTMQDGTVKKLVSGALGCACESVPSYATTYRALELPASLRQATPVYSLEKNEKIGFDPLG
jgi:hypothetical protein